jgi:hypothetical protein
VKPGGTRLLVPVEREIVLAIEPGLVNHRRPPDKRQDFYQPCDRNLTCGQFSPVLGWLDLVPVTSYHVVAFRGFHLRAILANQQHKSRLFDSLPMKLQLEPVNEQRLKHGQELRLGSLGWLFGFRLDAKAIGPLRPLRFAFDEAHRQLPRDADQMANPRRGNDAPAEGRSCGGLGGSVCRVNAVAPATDSRADLVGLH